MAFFFSKGRFSYEKFDMKRNNNWKQRKQNGSKNGNKMEALTQHL